MGLVFRAGGILNLEWNWHYFLSCRIHAKHCVSLRHTSLGSMAADLEWNCVGQGTKSQFGSSAWLVTAERINRFTMGIGPGGIKMRQMKHLRRSEAPYSSHSIERRRMRRTCVSLGLMYSGINGDGVLIGDGSSVDLSEGGLGIRGNCPVNIGMELTLFLYLPDDEEPLFVLEATVAWTAGSLFGVELKEVSLRDGDRMRSFLRAQSVGQA